MKQRTGTRLLLHNQSGGRVENVLRCVGVLEIKHRIEPPGKVIKRSRDSLAVQPVVLDEAQNRALVGHGVIDVVLLREGRDHEERKTGTISATSLSMLNRDTRKGASTSSAFAGGGE